MWDIAKGAAIISTKNGTYKLSKSVGLILCDGSYFPLIQEGQELPCKKLSMRFSVVDQSEDSLKDARFIFTDSSNPDERDVYDSMVIPLRGFEDEYLNLDCYVDQDNVLKVKICSNRVSDARSKVWKYERLKVCFHIEENSL